MRIFRAGVRRLSPIVDKTVILKLQQLSFAWIQEPTARREHPRIRTEQAGRRFVHRTSQRKEEAALAPVFSEIGHGRATKTDPNERHAVPRAARTESKERPLQQEVERTRAWGCR